MLSSQLLIIIATYVLKHNNFTKKQDERLGVSGSIAAYKAAALTSLLVKQRADVHVLMT